MRPDARFGWDLMHPKPFLNDTKTSLARRRFWGFVTRSRPTGTCDEPLRTSAWEAKKQQESKMLYFCLLKSQSLWASVSSEQVRASVGLNQRLWVQISVKVKGFFYLTCVVTSIFFCRDINDTLVTNHLDDRKTLLCW